MRACSKIVILTVIALFTSGLRAPSLPLLRLKQGSEEQISAYRADALPALTSARPGRSADPARKAPLFVILPSCLLSSPALSCRGEAARLSDQLASLPLLPRTSRGPPALA